MWHEGGHGFRVLLPQTNFKVLVAIQGFTRMGFIFKNRKRKIHWKESWVYAVVRQEDVFHFLRHIEPYCIVKREKIKYALPNIKKNLIERRARVRLQAHRIDVARRLRNSGYTYRRIGEKLEVDFGYIRRLMRKGKKMKWWA